MMKSMLIVAFCFIIALVSVAQAGEIKSNEDLRGMGVQQIEEYLGTLSKEDLAKTVASAVASNDSRLARVVLVATANAINAKPEVDTRVDFANAITAAAPSVKFVVKKDGTVVLSILDFVLRENDSVRNISRPAAVAP